MAAKEEKMRKRETLKLLLEISRAKRLLLAERLRLDHQLFMLEQKQREVYRERFQPLLPL